MAELPQEFVFSQSSLQDFVDCARRFELRYLLRQRWPAQEVDDMLTFERRMEQGQDFHRLVQQHLLGIPAETLLSRTHDADLRRWFEAYLVNGLDNLPEQRYPERTLSVGFGNYLLMAKFDLLAIDAERAVIVDWKTSRKLPRREWLSKRLQTVVYRYVLATGGAVYNNGQAIAPEQIEMHYWYADHAGKTFSLPYDAAQYKADRRFLHGLLRDIEERDEFALTPDSTRCRFCAYRSLCDRGREAGSLAEWDAADYDEGDLSDFSIDLDQIAEIEF